MTLGCSYASASAQCGPAVDGVEMSDVQLRIRFSVLHPQDKNWRRRLNSVRGRKAPLVHGQSHPAARVDVEQGLLQWHVAEGADKRNIHLRLANCYVYVLAVPVTQFEKVIAADVGNKIAKRTIGGDHLPAQAACIQLGRRQVQSYQ